MAYNTFRREPKQVRVKEMPYRFQTQSKFTGIFNNDNFLDVDQESCADANNLWVNKLGTLTTRPRLALDTNLLDNSIKDFIGTSAKLIQIYTHREIIIVQYTSNDEVFCVVKYNGRIFGPVPTATNELKFFYDRYFYILDKENIRAINIDQTIEHDDRLPFGEWKDIEEIAYIPTTQIVTNGVVGKGENLNLLTRKERRQFVYENPESFDLSSLIGQEITLNLGDKKYDIKSPEYPNGVDRNIPYLLMQEYSPNIMNRPYKYLVAEDNFIIYRLESGPNGTTIYISVSGQLFSFCGNFSQKNIEEFFISKDGTIIAWRDEQTFNLYKVFGGNDTIISYQGIPDISYTFQNFKRASNDNWTILTRLVNQVLSAQIIAIDMFVIATISEDNRCEIFSKQPLFSIQTGNNNLAATVQIANSPSDITNATLAEKTVIGDFIKVIKDATLPSPNTNNTSWYEITGLSPTVVGPVLVNQNPDNYTNTNRLALNPDVVNVGQIKCYQYNTAYYRGSNNFIDNNPYWSQFQILFLGDKGNNLGIYGFTLNCLTATNPSYNLTYVPNFIDNSGFVFQNLSGEQANTPSRDAGFFLINKVDDWKLLYSQDDSLVFIVTRFQGTNLDLYAASFVLSDGVDFENPFSILFINNGWFDVGSRFKVFATDNQYTILNQYTTITITNYKNSVNFVEKEQIPDNITITNNLPGLNIYPILGSSYNNGTFFAMVGNKLFSTILRTVVSFEQLFTRDNFNEQIFQAEHIIEFQNNVFLGQRNAIFVSEVTDPSVKMLYFPEYNLNNLGESNKITGFLRIGDNVLAIFKHNELYYATLSEIIIDNQTTHQYLYTKSKLVTGAIDGTNQIVTDYSNTPIYISLSGVSALNIEQLTASTERQSNLIGEKIQKLVNEQDKTKMRLYAQDFWLYIYVPQTAGTIIFLLDTRDGSWWKWTLPYVLTNIFEYNNEIYCTANVQGSPLCLKFENDESLVRTSAYKTEYYDYPRKIINWNYTSQKLHLNQESRYKPHLLDANYLKTVLGLTIFLNEIDEFSEYSFNYKFIGYRDFVADGTPTLVQGKSEVAKTLVLRANMAKLNLVQFILTSDNENAIQNKINISSIGIKFLQGEMVR